MNMQTIQEKRSLLSKQIIALQTKAIVTGESIYMHRANKKMVEYEKLDKLIIGGDYE